jgi:hypothetical protein
MCNLGIDLSTNRNATSNISCFGLGSTQPPSPEVRKVLLTGFVLFYETHLVLWWFHVQFLVVLCTYRAAVICILWYA